MDLKVNKLLGILINNGLVVATQNKVLILNFLLQVQSNQELIVSLFGHQRRILKISSRKISNSKRKWFLGLL